MAAIPGNGDQARRSASHINTDRRDAAQEPPVASVVVLSYNSQRTIRACLQSLAAQRTSLPFEIVVVDSSADSTPAIVEKEFPRARLIHLSARALPGETRNVGIHNSSGEVIAFLASDCIADPEWLETRVQRHREGFAAVGGAITNANPHSVVGWANYLMEYVFCLPNRPREVVKGKIIHNLSYRRALFERYGLYRTDLSLGEDTIFNRRLMLHDEPVLFDPAIRTGHINPTSLRHFLGHQYEHGAEFFRGCRNGDLSYFRTAENGLGSALYQVLVSYPWMRIKTCTRQVVRQQRGMLGRLIVSFPFLVLGIYSAALGAAAEAVRRTRAKSSSAVPERQANDATR
jgi:glycosyltransferase involved in cell wall biosynthesis